MNSVDAEFLAKARSHLSAQIMLTQSQHSYFSSMSGEKGNHYVEALLTNVATKVFHQLGDALSARFASELLGHHKEVKINLNPRKPETPYKQLIQGTEYDASYSEDYQPILQPRVFMEGLRSGGISNDMIVDGIVISANQFKDGKRFLKVAFKQK
jgi:hypothetical protein